MLYSKDLILKLGEIVDCKLLNAYYVSGSFYSIQLNYVILHHI